MIFRITSLFPLWILIVSVASFLHPSIISWFKGDYIPYALAVIMLGMGLTLDINDFKQVAKFPGSVFLGLTLQYTVMPALGYLIAYVMELPAPFAAGLILVSCCPGGTASNVLTFIARANVALSVTLTSISTFLAILATPILTSLLVGNRIEVNAAGLFYSTVKVIIIPVAAGVILNHFLPKFTRKAAVISPLLAVIAIILIVASVIAGAKEHIIKSGAQLLISVFSLHSGGFLLGYILSYAVNKDTITSRTISIEVGMQNSGLGVVLAKQNFSDPIVAVPSAVSSLAHSLIASVLAAFWRKKV